MTDAQNCSVPPVTLCKMCKHSIPFGALKCADCDSYQDWRNLFGISNTALALIVAVVSVSAQAIPIVKEVFTPIGEHVEVLIPTQVYSEKADVYFSNNGRAPAIVENNIKVTIDGKTAENYLVTDRLGTYLIERGKTTHMTFGWSIGPHLAEGDYSKCKAEINIRRLDGSIRTLYKVFDCKWHYV
jgi:hypothetical protein